MKARVAFVGLVILLIDVSAGGAVSSWVTAQRLSSQDASLSVTSRGNDRETPFSSGGARLFATSFNQGIVELNPATGEILNILEPPIGISVFDAMAFDGRSLYLLNHGSDPDNIYEIHPDTGGVLAKHPISDSGFLHGMAVLDNQLYLLDSARDDIVIYSLSTDMIVGRVDVDATNNGNPDADLSGGLGAITTGGNGLIAGTSGDSIVELNPSTGLIVNSFPYTGSPVSGDIGVGVVAGEIYVGNNTGLADQIVVYSRGGTELRKLTVEGSIGIQSIGADDAESQGGSAPSLIFAQYADGETGGFSNASRIFLVAGENAESGEVHFLDPDGNLREVGIGGENLSKVPFDLPARGAMEIVTDGTGALKNGPVEVYSTLGQVSQLEGAEAYDFLGFSVSVPSSSPKLKFRGYVNFDQEERTAIAVYNPDKTHSVELALVLYGADGEQADASTLGLNAGQQVAVFLDSSTLFGDSIEGDFRGTLTITSEVIPVAVLSLIMDKATGALVVVSLE